MITKGHVSGKKFPLNRCKHTTSAYSKGKFDKTTKICKISDRLSSYDMEFYLFKNKI